MLHSSWFWNHPQLKLGHQLFKWAGLKPLADISLYWLVHRDPSNGLWNNPYRTAQSIFYIQQITTGFGHCARGYLKFFTIFLWKYNFRQTCNPSNQGKCVKWSANGRDQLPIANCDLCGYLVKRSFFKGDHGYPTLGCETARMLARHHQDYMFRLPELMICRWNTGRGVASKVILLMAEILHHLECQKPSK